MLVQRRPPIVDDLRIVRRAGRHVLVHRRPLLIPRNPEPRAFGDEHVVRHLKDARAAGRRRSRVGVDRGGPLVLDDSLEGQRVADAQALEGHHVAEGLGGGVDVDGGFEFDGAERVSIAAAAACGREAAVRVGQYGVQVRLPPLLQLAAADHARVFVYPALFVGVLGAWGRHVVLVLLDAPQEAPQLGAVDGAVLVDGDEAHEAEGEGHVADRVDHGDEPGFADEFGGREDASEVSGFAARDEGALHLELVRVGDDLAGRQDGFGDEMIGERADAGTGGGGEVVWQDVAEWERMFAVAESLGPNQDFPRLQRGVLGIAIETSVYHGLFVRMGSSKFNSHLVNGDWVRRDSHFELSRHEKTWRFVRGVSQEKDWW